MMSFGTTARAYPRFKPLSLVPLPVAAGPLSAAMKDAAQTLAGMVEGGEYDELMPHQRTELRMLAMAICGWSDQVDTMEVERLPGRPRQTLRARLGRLFPRLRQV